MPRPTNEQMIATLIDAIREEEAISVNRLSAQLQATWKPSTVDSILKSALDAGLVTKGKGGGGGVLRLTTLASETPDENSQTQFMDALYECMARSSTAYAKSSDIQGALGWSDELFRGVRAMLQAQDRITLRRGPGARVYPESPADSDAEPASRPKGDTVEPKDARASIGGLVKKPSEERKQELLDAITQHPDLTNGALRARLGWPEYEYWQVRTELVDEGKIVTAPGDDAKVSSDGNRTAPDPNVIRILQTVMAAPDQEMQISDISSRLDITPESAVMACTRLLRFRFLQSSGDRVMLANTFYDGGPEAGMVMLLRQFGDRDYAVKDTVTKRTGWNSDELQKTINMCVAHIPPLIKDDGEIVLKLDAVKSFLDQHKDDSGTTIFRSLTDFEELRAAVARGHVTAFVGAGASVDARLPAWIDLAKDMSESLKDGSARKEVFTMLDEKDLVGAMSAIEQQIGGQEFKKVVQQRLSTARCQYPSTALIVALGCVAEKFEAIITTNIDSLLEANLKCKLVAELNPAVLSEARNGGRKLIHAHGVLDQPHTWIFTRKQYNKAFYGNQAYRGAIGGLFTNSTLMFVGYGMSDCEIDAILDHIEGSYSDSQHGTHYFFIKASEADDRPYFIQRLRSLGMTPILFSEFEDLPILIAQLARTAD